MTKFESRETELRYYKTLREFGITHIVWGAGHVVTDDDVDYIIRTKGELMDNDVHNVPCEEFP